MRHDVIVVGGGWAGLAAALQLARARRSVLVVDKGQPRNRFAAASHGFLGQDGKPPAEIMAEARRQLLAYPTASLRHGEAVAAEPTTEGFAVTLAPDERLEAARLILATGIVDLLPDVPGVAERWGRTVLHCPYCHGYEVRGGRLGVLATGEASLHQALLLPDWAEEVTLFTNGAVDPDEPQRERLAARGVGIENGPVAALVGTVPGLEGVRLADDRVIPVDAVFTTPRTRMASPLAEQLGCACDDGPFGPVLRTDNFKQATVPGVFAAGDAARPVHNATWAAADGVAAGIFAHQSLVLGDDPWRRHPEVVTR